MKILIYFTFLYSIFIAAQNSGWNERGRIEFELTDVKTLNAQNRFQNVFQAGEEVYVILYWTVYKVRGQHEESVEILVRRNQEQPNRIQSSIKDRSREGNWSFHLPLSIHRQGRYNAMVSLKIGREIRQRSISFEIQNIPPSSGGGRYRVIGAGIIRDTQTNLEWLVGPDRDVNWGEAKSWIDSISPSRHGRGWRFPTKQEIAGLYQRGRGRCNIDPVFISPRKTLWVWGEPYGSLCAWNFNFHEALEGWHACTLKDNFRVFAVRNRRD